MCVYVCVCVSVPMSRSEDSLEEFAVSFYHVGPGEWKSRPQIKGKCVNP